MPFFGARGHAYRRGRSKGRTLMAQGWDLAGAEAAGIIPLWTPSICMYRLSDGSTCNQQVTHWTQMRGYKETCRQHIEVQWAFLRDRFGIGFKEVKLTYDQVVSDPTKNERLLARLMASVHCEECNRLLTEREYVSYRKRCREHRRTRAKKVIHSVIEGLLNPRSPEPVLS